MDKICFSVGPLVIYWYGVMIAAAFIACMLHLAVLARRAGRPYAAVSDLGFWMMLAGILGARLAYVGANITQYISEPGAIFRVDQGGLIYYGGFIGAALALIILARIRHESVLTLGDFVATALPLGQAIGRIGCFMNDCCYGQPATLPWSVAAEGTLRHPVQLYESAACLVVYVVLLIVYLRRRVPGQTMAAYLVLYPLARFFLEFFRGDERTRWLGLSVAQEISLALILTGVALWFVLLHTAKPASPPQSRHPVHPGAG